MWVTQFKSNRRIKQREKGNWKRKPCENVLLLSHTDSDNSINYIDTNLFVHANNQEICVKVLFLTTNMMLQHISLMVKPYSWKAGELSKTLDKHITWKGSKVKSFKYLLFFFIEWNIISVPCFHQVCFMRVKANWWDESKKFKHTRVYVAFKWHKPDKFDKF